MGKPFTEAEAYALREEIIAASPRIMANVRVYQRGGLWYVEDKDTYRSYCSQEEYDEVNSDGKSE